MAVMADVMLEEEVCLNFRKNSEFLVVSIDSKADVIDCKEFFEEFYHLATGFNYDIDTGIPDDETEAEMYLTRLQEEFDEKMKNNLGDKYLPGNNDPDTINSK
jgi:predicted aldo/keto reductase-like oxidoreductase